MLTRLSLTKRAIIPLWILALALGQGLIFLYLAPAWTLPDEPGHYEYARYLSHPVADQQGLQVEILQELARANFWPHTGRPTPEPLPETFSADPLLALSGTQFSQPATYYLPLAWWWRLHSHTPSEHVRQARLYSLLLTISVPLLGWWITGRIWPEKPGLQLSTGLLLALHPMAGYIGIAFNNDALAMLVGASACALLLYLAMTPASRWAWLIALVLSLSGLWVKRTLWFLLPAWLLLQWIAPRSHLLRRRPRLWLAIAGATFVLVVLFLRWPDPHRPAAWNAWGWDGRGARVHTAESMALALVDRSEQHRALLEQVLWHHRVLPLRGQTLTLQAQVRGDVEVALSLDDGERVSQAVCPGSEDWTPCKLQHQLSPEATLLHVHLASGRRGAADLLGTALLREVALTTESGAVNLLRNPDGVQPAAWVESLWRSLKASTGWSWGSLRAFNQPEVLHPAAMLRYVWYGLLTLAGFWGWFGWLDVRLPWPIYVVLAILTAMGVLGAARHILELVRASVCAEALEGRPATLAHTPELRALLTSLLLVSLALVQIALPMLGREWQPQGRYLFPALLPISLLLVAGWAQYVKAAGRLPWLVAVGGLSLNAVSWLVLWLRYGGL